LQGNLTGETLKGISNSREKLSNSRLQSGSEIRTA